MTTPIPAKRLSPSSVQSRCKLALKQTFEQINRGTSVDGKGYVDCAQSNLLSGIAIGAVRQEFGDGAGGELKGKMRAIHSSSALAVNVFQPLRERKLSLSLAGERNLRVTGFEVKKSAGIANRTPPHLDVITETDDAVVAIESKCTEYICRKVPEFSDEYANQIGDARRDGRWFSEMLRINQSGDHGYCFLDVAQLIKHAFGLALQADGRRTTLLYLFWEPSDAPLSPLFAAHRREIEQFAKHVAGDTISFAAMSYPDLWDAWAVSDNDFLKAHAMRLRERYWVAMNFMDTPRPSDCAPEQAKL